MAQRAIIGINGDLLPFDESLDKIQTQGIGGGSVTWVPEADTRCVAITITENGSKSASDEGVYGWDYVAVSVPGSSVTGIDPATGQETTVTVDPDTGDIVKTVVPTEIRVTTLPTKTDYTDGETIDYSGIVAHAYSSTGQDMGAVPFGELVFPVTTAQSSGDEKKATSDLDTGAFTQPIPISGSVVFSGYASNGYVKYYYRFTPINGAALVVMRNVPGQTIILYASRNNGDAMMEEYVWTNERLGEQTREFTTYITRRTYTADGKTVYYGVLSASRSTDMQNEPMVVNPRIVSYGEDGKMAAAAWTAIYGTIIGEDQSIPVQWPRTGDGAILETSFTINVTGGAA